MRLSAPIRDQMNMAHSPAREVDGHAAGRGYARGRVGLVGRLEAVTCRWSAWPAAWKRYLPPVGLAGRLERLPTVGPRHLALVRTS